MFACLFLFMGAPSGQGANPLAMWLPIILLFVIVYLLVLRPRAKRRTEATSNEPLDAPKMVESTFPHKWFWPMAVSSFLMSLVSPSLVNPANSSESKQETAVLLIVFGLFMLVYLLFFTYHLWKRIQDGKTAITPGRAVGFLFIPFFNYAWIFWVWAGYAKELNKFRERHGLPGRASKGITITFTIAWLLSGLLSLSPAAPIGFLFLTIMLMIFVAHTGRLAGDFKIEALVKVSEQRPATPIKQEHDPVLTSVKIENQTGSELEVYNIYYEEELIDFVGPGKSEVFTSKEAVFKLRVLGKNVDLTKSFEGTGNAWVIQCIQSSEVVEPEEQKYALLKEEKFWLPSIESKYLQTTFAQLEQDSGPGGNQFKEAIQYWNSEEFEKAFELFEQALNIGLTPTYKCGAHSFLGQIHLKRGKLDLAVDQLLKCLEIQQKVASAAWETAIRLYIIYNEAGMYQYANSLRSVADAANTRGLYLTADTENEIRELVKQWLKKTDAKTVEKESSGDVSQILLPFESVSLQKICAVCGESVSQDAIQCPKCGRGIFETQKSYNEASVESLRATLNAEALGKIKEVTMNTDFGRLENSKAEPSALTIGKRLNGARYNVSNYASKSGRAGKCRDCGAIVKLTDAKEVCHDWDGVDAYHFYCPSCYAPSEYYKGQLLGADGKPVIDQHSWYYE